MNNNDLPKISIILPVFNIEKYIRKCMDSILDQSYLDFECLCINDCSTDKTLSILESYSAIDKRIKIFSMLVNGGSGKARNFGIKQAHGKYITFIDHDDFVDKEWLLKIYTEMEHTNADCVYCAYAEYFEETDMYENHYFPSNFLKINYLMENSKKYPLANSYFPPWLKLVKASIIHDNNIVFDENFNRFDDVLFTELLIDHIHSISFVNEILYYHRMHKTSFTVAAESDPDMYFDHFKTLKSIENIYGDNKKIRTVLFRMYPFLSSYIKTVSSKQIYIKQLFYYIDKYKLGLSKKIIAFNILNEYYFDNIKVFLKKRVPKIYSMVKNIFVK